MKKIIFIIGFFVSFLSFGQDLEDVYIIDTTMIDNDTVVIFSDNSWQLLSKIPNPEELLPPIRSNNKIDTAYFLNNNWSNNRTYQKGVNLYNMKDSFEVYVPGILEETPVFPIKDKVVSTFKIRWGKWHQGIDIRAAVGTPVKASFSGKVRYAKMNGGGYGYLIIIRHYNGLETYYAHLSKLMVKPNQYVKAGDIIGYSGNTGHSTGPHLHYEIRFCENSFNPEMIWDINTFEVKNLSITITNRLFAYKNRTNREIEIKKYMGESDGTTTPSNTNKRKVRNRNAYYGNMGEK